jgi:hypothetical protein
MPFGQGKDQQCYQWKTFVIKLLLPSHQAGVNVLYKRGDSTGINLNLKLLRLLFF